MANVDEVGENIFMIDCELYGIPRFGSVYLVNEEKKALIDSGASTSASTILDGISRASVRAEDIDYVIPTHIHLDHAGGAGILLRDMPKARVLVHHQGAKHLVNPARLISSMVEAQGEEAVTKYGTAVPIEAERVKPVYDGDELKLGKKQTLKFIEAPGHAPHELCLYETRNRGLFSGDAVGILADGVLLPVLPPPGFDSELSKNTLEKLKKLNASRIYFAHFGVTSRVNDYLQLALDKLRAWDSLFSDTMEDSELEEAAGKMAAQARADLEPVKNMKSLYQHLAGVTVSLNMAGYIKYFQKRREASLSRGRKGESKQG